MEKKKVAFHTLGCKLNFAESGTMSRDFVRKGYEIVDFDQKADVYVVHTCTVTAVAEKKCRAAISRASRTNPEAQVAVVGCYAQLRHSELIKMPGVSIVLDNTEKYRLAEIVEQTSGSLSGYQPCYHENGKGFNTDHDFHPSWSDESRTRTFLKIQDGCNHFCTYCAIPYARGRSRSATISQVLESVETIVAAGTREMVFTGVNIGDYGKPNGQSFFELLQSLQQAVHPPRIRISSIEPELLTDQIIQLVALSDCFMPHFHLPLQSGSDAVLKAMKRKYDKSLFANRVGTIKKHIPDACIAADVIVGFPGETEENFQEMLDFLRMLPISYLHVFSYSERPGTPAASLPNKVAPRDKQIRSEILHKLSEEKLELFYQQNRGKENDVLFESSNQNGMMEGFTRNYLRVKTPYNQHLVNALVKVTLNQRHPDGAFLVENPINTL